MTNKPSQSVTPEVDDALIEKIALALWDWHNEGRKGQIIDIEWSLLRSDYIEQAEIALSVIRQHSQKESGGDGWKLAEHNTLPKEGVYSAVTMKAIGFIPLTAIQTERFIIWKSGSHPRPSPRHKMRNDMSLKKVEKQKCSQCWRRAYCTKKTFRWWWFPKETWLCIDCAFAEPQDERE